MPKKNKTKKTGKKSINRLKRKNIKPLRASSKKTTKKTAKSRKIEVKKGASLPKKEKLIGRVTHYFPKVKVAVVKLSSPLSVGESIRIIGGEKTDFQQKVNSIEINHKKIKKAKAKNEIGLRVKKIVRDKYRVYKINKK